MVKRIKKKERGVALLAVLLGVAMMTLIVVDFAMTSGLGFVSAANQANELRANYLARSAISVGLGLLAASARAQALAQTAANQTTNTSTADTLNDPWAAPFPPMPLEGGTVSLSIVDEDRKLNINSMVVNGRPNLPAIQKMQRLFTVLDVDVNLVQAMVDWITPNGGNSIGGDYYLQLKPPYQPRYGPMPTLGDLQMVKGFNEAIFNRVSPFLSVITQNLNQVNVNTAPPQVLAALEPVLMEDQKLVMTIVDYRAQQPFSNPTDVLNLLNLPNQSGPTGLSNDIVVKSGYFTISGMGTYAGARKIVTATFQRQQNGVGILNAWRED